jgi:hypothetical protein
VLLELLLGALGRGVEPRDALVDGRLERRLVVALPLVGQLVVLERVAEVVGVRLEAVAGGDALGGGSVLLGVPKQREEGEWSVSACESNARANKGDPLLGVGNHLLDVLLREAALVVGDGNLVRLAGRLVGGRDVDDPTAPLPARGAAPMHPA